RDATVTGVQTCALPILILGIVAGLRRGPAGVALGYSTAMVLLVVPIVAWAKHGTGMTAWDCLNSIKRPLVAGAVAGAAGWLFRRSEEGRGGKEWGVRRS